MFIYAKHDQLAGYLISAFVIGSTLNVRLEDCSVAAFPYGSPAHAEGALSALARSVAEGAHAHQLPEANRSGPATIAAPVPDGELLKCAKPRPSAFLHGVQNDPRPRPIFIGNRHGAGFLVSAWVKRQLFYAQTRKGEVLVEHYPSAKAALAELATLIDFASEHVVEYGPRFYALPSNQSLQSLEGECPDAYQNDNLQDEE